MSSQSSLLRLDGLQKHFYEDDNLLTRVLPNRELKTVRAVDGDDLAAAEGTTLGLVGGSGRGTRTPARPVNGSRRRRRSGTSSAR